MAGPNQGDGAGTIDRIVHGTLQVIELGAIVLIVVVCVKSGYHSYQLKTDWTFYEILHGLSENWKGALILGALLFYRSLHLVLAGTEQLYSFFRRKEAKPAGPGQTFRVPPPPPPPTLVRK